jgi:predicted P-loop ATPase
MIKNIFTFYPNIFKEINIQIGFEDVFKYLHLYKNETESCKELYQMYSKTKKEIYSDYKTKNLPAVTFNCSIQSNKGHKKENLKEISGYLHLDYDGISELDKLKECLKQIPFTTLIFTSPSGVGLKVIVKVKKLLPEKFYNLFKQVDEYYTSEIFRLIGLNINSDKQCSNFNRLCFLCCDPEYYYNEKAETFNVKEKEITKVVEEGGVVYNLSKQDEKILDKLVQYIVDSKVDITYNYDEWIRIGFVIRNTIKDYNHGLSYFKKVSQFYPHYDEKKCIEKFKSLYNAPETGTKVRIPTLYRIMEKNDITMFLTKDEITTINNAKIKLEDCKQIMIDEGFTVDYCVIKRKRILNYKNKSLLIDESGNDTVHFMRGWFLENYSFNISNGDIDMIINNLPKNEYSFVYDLLSLNKNSGESEIEKVLECFISDDKFKDEKILRFLMGCIHNWIRNPNQRKYDEMLILQSNNSIGKTSLINDFLFSPFKENRGLTYLSESTNFYENNKDLVYQDLTSLVNYKPEISDTIGKKADAIKSYISKKTFPQRRPYDRTDQTFQSFASFIGDTNNTYFLPDDINNRRFIVLKLNKLIFMEFDDDTNRYIKRDINWLKFWGQLYQLYFDGKTYEDFYKIGSEDNEEYVSVDRDYQIMKQIIEKGKDNEWIHIDDLVPHIEANGYRLSDTKKQKILNHLIRLGFKSQVRWDKDKKKSIRGYYNITINPSITVKGGVISDMEKYIFTDGKNKLN